MKTPGLIAAAKQQRTLTATVPQGALVARAAALSGDAMTRVEHTDRATLIAERDALAGALAAIRIENEQLNGLVLQLAALLEATDSETPESNVTDYLANAERVKDALELRATEFSSAAGLVDLASAREADSDERR